MPDAKGRPLKAGDLVLVPCRITAVSPTEDYCNVALETVFSRRPDGKVEHIGEINTAVTLRANAGDENDITELQPQPQPEPESQPDPAPEAKAAPETQPEPQPEPAPEAKAEPEQGTESKETV